VPRGARALLAQGREAAQAVTAAVSLRGRLAPLGWTLPLRGRARAPDKK